MNQKIKKISRATYLLAGTVVVVRLLFPTPVMSFNLFREIKKGLTKTSHFIVKLPDKTTRWMGPVIGPIARTVLLKNIAAHKTLGAIFSKAHHVHKARLTEKEVQTALADMRKMYRDEANKLYDQASQLQLARDQLGQQLISRDISLEDYQQQVIAIDKLIDIQNQLGDELNQKADNFRSHHITKIIGSNLLKNLLGEVKNIITHEVSNEVLNLVNVDVLDRLISSGGQVDALIDVLIAGDLSDALKGEKDNIDIDALKDRIRDQIKQAIKENRDNLNENWKAELQNIIQQAIKEVKDSKADRQETSEKVDEVVKKNQKVEIPVDENGCKPGYIFKANSGVGCVQENCNSIESAHWSYVGDCVCGSSGSMEENPKDPNKECHYSLNKSDCPGCVYACVHTNEDCPLDGIGE